MQSIPRGHSELADPLKRATISIPLNIAEGAGKPTDKDRACFHAIAPGSAMECGAILEIMHLQAVAEPKTLIEAKSLRVRLVAMLSKMCLRSGDEDARAHGNEYEDGSCAKAEKLATAP